MKIGIMNNIYSNKASNQKNVLQNKPQTAEQPDKFVKSSSKPADSVSFKGDGDSMIKTLTIFALESKAPEMIGNLKSFFMNDDVAVFGNALKTIKENGKKEHFDVLEPMLDDEDRRVRMGAAFGLKLISDKEQVDCPQKALDIIDEVMKKD